MWRAAIIAAILAVPAPAAAPIPTTEVYDGPPPVRFMGSQQAQVSFGTLDQCGKPPEGKEFAGCMRSGPVIHMPNPCNFPRERFATTMCHEMAHVNGWPRRHGP